MSDQKTSWRCYNCGSQNEFKFCDCGVMNKNFPEVNYAIGPDCYNRREFEMEVLNELKKDPEFIRDTKGLSLDQILDLKKIPYVKYST